MLVVLWIPGQAFACSREPLNSIMYQTSVIAETRRP